MELKRQVDANNQFLTWFDAGEKQIIDDARSAYRMNLDDAETREELGLSQLPSTKSTEYVDHFVDTALPLYHQSRDAITFQALDCDVNKDHLAKLLTEIFRIRSKPQYFDFFNWHAQALTAVATDGIVCALVSWIKETKTKKSKQYLLIDELGEAKEVSEENYNLAKKNLPPGFSTDAKDIETPITVKDTWSIDLLEPGKDIIWDVKIPQLDVNMGQFCIVKLRKSAQWIMNKSKQGIFKKLKLSEVKEFLKTGLDVNKDNSATTPDVDYVDQDEFNEAEVWFAFEKVDNEWMVSFSIEGKFELSESDKTVNEVFFAGREVNRLPVVIGAIKMKLWESLGRGIPETIKPIEREYIDHINNFNDLVKQISQGGRARFQPGTDIDEEQVLRARAFYADKDDVEFMPVQQGVLESLRGADFTNTKINSLVPTTPGGVGRDVVPKGAGDDTLGSLQLTMQRADGKMSVNLLTYNNTFFIPIMWLIAQNEFAYETNEMLTRLAAKKAKVAPPMMGYNIDFRQLDFDVDIQILAGLGTVPPSQKGQALIQMATLAKTLGITGDVLKLFAELSEINGYDADAFKPQIMQPAQPQPDYKLNLAIDLIQLMSIEPTAGKFLLDKMMQGGMDVSAKVDGKNPQTEKMINEAKQNGGGYMAPDRTGTVVDGTGQAALGMSRGGMNSNAAG